MKIVVGNADFFVGGGLIATPCPHYVPSIVANLIIIGVTTLEKAISDWEHGI